MFPSPKILNGLVESICNTCSKGELFLKETSNLQNRQRENRDGTEQHIYPVCCAINYQALVHIGKEILHKQTSLLLF